MSVPTSAGAVSRNDGRLRYGRERAAILLLLFGGFAVYVGWIVGVVLLWRSPKWSTRDKWIGTLVIPMGLTTTSFVFWFAFGPSTYSPSSRAPVLWGAIFAIVLAAPLVTAVYLARRARVRSAPGS